MVPLNLPNLLTVVRILLVPVVVVALLAETPNADMLAAIVFAVAAFTDGLDGYIARSRGSVTTFGKLMDPLADKLLIIAALVSLVSLGRIAAWVAMVIIAREFAVTALRMLAVEQGVVIPASTLGKLKTITQVAAIFAVIAVSSTPLWVDLLVYLAVATTVVSGVDYFFGLRRRIEDARRERTREPRGPSAPPEALGGGALEPLAHRHVVRRVRARLELAADLPGQPVALGTTLCWWIVSRFSWRARDECGLVQRPGSAQRAAHHLAHAVLDEAGAAVRLLDDRALVGALHQLVDLRAHRVLDDRSSVSALTLHVAALGAADVERADAALVVGRDRHGLEDALDLVVGEALVQQPLARAPGDQLLRARAGGHALRLHADEASHSALGSTAVPISVYSSCVRMPVTGVSLYSG